MKIKLFLFAILMYNISMNSQNVFHMVHPTMGDFMGANMRQESQRNIPIVKKIKNLRYYHSWLDDVGFAPDSLARNFNEHDTLMKYQYNTTLNGNLPGYTYDNFYGSLKNSIMPSLTYISPWLRGYKLGTDNPYDDRSYQQKPIPLVKSYHYEGAIFDANNNRILNLPDRNIFMADSVTQDLPSHYINQAKRMTLMAQRYGSGITSCSPYFQRSYRTSEMYPGKSRLASIQYFENCNETDKTWLDDQYNGKYNSWYQIAATQLGALLSASYDGHERSPEFLVDSCTTEAGTKYQYLGIKNVDENAKQVFPGIADFRGQYVNRVAEWCMDHRVDKKLPFEVINFHHYSTYGQLGDIQRAGINELANSSNFGPYGISPEEDDLVGDMKYCFNVGMYNYKTNTSQANKAAIEAEYANKEIWFTEFGWDNQNNPFSQYEATNSVSICKTCPDNIRRLKQAQWQMRGFLATANTNQVSRAYTYEMADEGGAGQFQSCGMVSSDYKQYKESYYYYMTLNNVLKNYYHNEINAGLNPKYINLPNADPPIFYFNNFRRLNTDIDEDLMVLHGDLVEKKDSIYCYKFKNDAQEIIYAVWSGTNGDKSVGYNRSGTIDLPIYTNDDYTSVTYIVPEILDENGVKYQLNNVSSVDLNGKYLTTITGLPVSETPIFIKLGDNTTDDVRPKNVVNITVENTCCKSIRLCWGLENDNTKSNPSYYNIYTSDNNNLQNLDLTQLTLLQQNLPGGLFCTNIGGLTNGKEYTFYVIPFNANRDPASNDFSKFAKITKTVNNCTSNCLGNTGYSISYSGTDPKQTRIFDINSTGCSDIFENPIYCDAANGDTLGWSTFANKDDEFIITFNNLVHISFAYIRHLFGTGALTIDYLGCCEEWYPLVTVDLRYGGDLCGSVESVSNFGNIKVKKLRIRRSGTDVKPQKIAFCTTPAAICKFTTSEDLKGKNPSNLAYNYIGTNSTSVSFEAAHISIDDMFQSIENYDVKLSSQWEGNTLIAPMTIPIKLGHNETISDFIINDLAPNTTYKLEIYPNYKFPCFVQVDPKLDTFSVSPLTGIFTTKGLSNTQSNINQRKSNTPGTIPMIQPEIYIYPNPTQNEINIELPYTGYTMLQLFDMAGKLINTYPLDPKTRYLNLESSNWASGMYIIRAYGLNNPILNSKVIKE